MKKLIAYFTKGELLLWVGSMTAIIVSFLLFDRTSWLTLGASLVGVTSLIFCAKGNPAGQVLMIAFALMYGIISWGFAYYGEMMTYVFMSLPMAVVSLVAWLKNPYGEGKSEVRVNKLDKWEYVIAGVLAAWIYCKVKKLVFSDIINNKKTFDSTETKSLCSDISSLEVNFIN